MSKVTITLTDIPGALGVPGKLDLHVVYEPALDISIPSHEHALLMIGTLDQVAEAIGEPVHILMPADGKSVRMEPAHELPTLKRNTDGQVIGWDRGG